MSPSPTSAHGTRSAHWPIIAAVLLLAAVGAVIWALVAYAPGPVTPPVSMFSNQNIGTQQELAALQFAQAHRVQTVISYDLNPGNYSLTSGSIPAGPGCVVPQRLTQEQARQVPVCNELQWARSLGVGIMPSFTDQLKTTTANDTLVANAVRQLDGNPAITGYFIDDEQPAQPGDGDVPEWLRALAHRCAQMRLLTSKPLLGVFQWGDDRPDHHFQQFQFLEKVHAACPSMILGVDYYPYPETALSYQKYGPIADSPNGNPPQGGIQQIGASLHAIAGFNTMFVGQAFGWGAAYPDQTGAGGLGFPANAPPPDVNTMTWMLKASVYGQGQGGVGSVGVYSFADALKSGGPTQVFKVGQAIDNFRANP